MLIDKQILIVLLEYFFKEIRFVNLNEEIHIIALEFPKLLFII